MSDLLKKSVAYAFAIISAVFTFIPEVIFGKVILISEDVLKQFTLEGYTLEINIIVNRVLTFVIVWFFTAFGYKTYLLLRNKVSIKGNNYKITVEYGDLLKMKKCKKIINFDECFSTHVGTAPADIKPTSICGQYLTANPNLNIQLLLSNSHLKPLKSKSKYQGKERYESGRIVPNGDELLLAFAKLDKNGLGRFFTRDEYLECLSVLWEEIDKHYGQQDVCIPILGAGLTRFDGGSGASIPQQELLDMIIWSYKLSSHKIKSPCKLRIICRRDQEFVFVVSQNIKDKEKRSMTTMDQIHRIRELFYEQGKNLNEIAIIMNCDWRTVRKYVDMEDFSSPPPAPLRNEEHSSKLDPFKPQIDSWMEADKLAPRKQRHTAKRIYKRLKSENQDFSCSYRLVALYVRQRKEELNLNKTTGYIPLEHRPGEAQADFGTADFYENGKLHHEAKYLVLSFPYSNGGFFQLNYGENMECLLEGLAAIFEHIGGGPLRSGSITQGLL